MINSTGNLYHKDRVIGLVGATSVGVGAIVGGGILALAGAAFAETGPGAVVAFALNGLIAILTALSFAELSTTFPQSGGTYLFAKRVLSVQTAFIVGWVVWFASIVAAALYALGFASFVFIMCSQMFPSETTYIQGKISFQGTLVAIAVSATAFFTIRLMRRKAGSGTLLNIGKLIVFFLLITGGMIKLPQMSPSDIKTAMTPFFPDGTAGMFRAMGYTFIALQGFDLIAAVAGEIKNPRKNIPKAMLISLGTALSIYLPLLFIVATVGIKSGESITVLSTSHPEDIIAVAARNYLGVFGYWLVMTAAVFSMLSALQANLYAASRVAFAMARDRTLPWQIEYISRNKRIPVAAVFVTALVVSMLILVIPDIARAGAASSLIFLITFGLVHGIAILARIRGGADNAFRTAFFPLVPVLGIITCLSLALFQGIAVPSAGFISICWLLAGGMLYLTFFSRRAKIVDASAEAVDPQLLKLRGRSPLVLVPIANPENAEAMVTMAHMLASPRIGNVLLLSVVKTPEPFMPEYISDRLKDTQQILQEALTSSIVVGLYPEALTTVAPDPWIEISRVASTYRCESMLLGLTNLDVSDRENNLEKHLGTLMSSVTCDVVILRAPAGWLVSKIKKVLVPVRGHDIQDELRARLLGSLWRSGIREITFLRIVSGQTSTEACRKIREELINLYADEVPGHFQVKVVAGNSPETIIADHAVESDLVILGLRNIKRHGHTFGDLLLYVARNTECAVIMINKRT